MTRHRVWFSSAEEVTVHIKDCPDIDKIYDENVINVWIEVDYKGSLPPGLRRCGNCGNELKRRAVEKFMAKIKRYFHKDDNPPWRFW